jgi:hypothetical protein
VGAVAFVLILVCTETDEILRYDPAKDQVTLMAARLPTERYGASAVWAGPDAYVFGGWSGLHQGPQREIVRYDPTPGPPIALASWDPTADGVRVVWREPPEATHGSPLVGFSVERSAGDGPFSEIGFAGPEDRSFTDRWVAPGIYSYRVVAVTVHGSGDVSPPATAAVPPP